MKTITRSGKALVVRESKAAIMAAYTGAIPGRLCMHDGACKKKAISRGLCQSHAQEMYRLVRSGLVTLDQLVRAGRILPLKRSAKEYFLEGIIDLNERGVRRAS